MSDQDNIPTAPDETGPSAGNAAENAPATDGTNSLGSFIAHGVSAVREVGAAKRAHHNAREQLDIVLDRIDERERELDHRRDVERRFAQIVAEQQHEREDAEKVAAEEEKAAGKAQTELERLEQELKAVKATDDKTEKRLRDMYEEAQGGEELASKALERGRKRLEAANNALEAAVRRRSDDTAAAQRRIDDASMRLRSLEAQLADLERDPSSNTAEYAARKREISAELDVVTARLDAAQAALPSIIDAATSDVVDAQREIVEAEAPLKKLEATHESARAAAEKARDELDDARDEAAARQRDLKDAVSACKKELRQRTEQGERARERIRTADRLIAEAQDIHDHPEETELLAGQLEQDYRERNAQEETVDRLAAAEQGIRSQTRSKRLAFLAAVAVVVIVAVAIAAVALLSLGR